MEDSGEGLGSGIAAQVMLEECNLLKMPAAAILSENGIAYPITFDVL